jgi:solute carrier family 6 amino acid transporter-like protein 5/7/9/14
MVVMIMFQLLQLFSVLFFFMLFTLGLGSASSLANALITILHDQFFFIEKKWITLSVCVVGFLSGLVYVTPGGLWILDLVDSYGAGFIIYIIAILELIGMIWFYGLNNIVYDIEFMLKKKKLSIYWKLCWLLIPVVLFAVLIYSLAIGEELRHEKLPYPTSAIGNNFCISNW